ncbi:CDP-alcohol phosphatidyltransferase family protein [Kribbella sp. NPDC059898]|uniref:CDP-alcohol phosphatidyltransferase family protein n=1 Tax=Kribbella sp. NPDC059898 TaxID=3346995 RepID=UPI00365AF815
MTIEVSAQPALLLGVPNRITLIRTVVAMAVATYAFRTGDLTWLVVGYFSYWFGDSLDGWVARRRKPADHDPLRPPDRRTRRGSRWVVTLAPPRCGPRFRAIDGIGA